MTRTRVRAAALTMAAVAFGYRLFDMGGQFAGFTNDDFLHLALGQQVRLGALPFRDFVDPGMPLTYLVSALAQTIFGPRLLGDALVALTALAAGAALTCVVTARVTGSAAAGVSAALIVVLMKPRFYAYPKIALFALAAWALLRYASAPTRGRLAGLAGLTSVAFLFRYDYGVYIGAACACTVLLAHAPRPGLGAIRAMALAALAVLFLMPYAAYVEATQGVGEHISSARAFSRVEDARTRGAMPYAPELGRWIDAARPSASDAAGWQNWYARARMLLPVAGSTLFYLWLFAAPAAIVALTAAAVRRGGVPEVPFAPAMAGIAVLAAGACYGFLRDMSHARLSDPVVPVAILLAWLGAHAWRTPRGRPLARGLVAAVAVMMALSMTVIAEVPTTVARIAGSSSLRGPDDRLREVPRLLLASPPVAGPRSPNVAASVTFARYLHRCTAPGDRILIVGFAPEVFVYANRGFAAGHPRFVRGYYQRTTEQRQMGAWLESERVPVIAVPTDGDYTPEYPLLYHHLRRHYREVGVVHATFRVFVSNEIRPAGRDAESRLPCFAYARP